MSNALATAGNPLEDFRQRVLEKLKTDIGSLMPDEVLASLVEQAVKEQFFKPQKVRNPDRSYSQPEMIDGPSWFMTEIKNQMEPLLQEAAKEFVTQHKAEIEGAIKAAVDKDKLLFASAAAIGDAVKIGMANTAMDIMNQMRSSGAMRW